MESNSPASGLSSHRFRQSTSESNPTFTAMNDSKHTQQFQQCASSICLTIYQHYRICCFLLKCYYILSSGDLTFSAKLRLGAVYMI